MKGFSLKLITWMESFISGGSMAVIVYEEVGQFFPGKKNAFDMEIFYLCYY